MLSAARNWIDASPVRKWIAAALSVAAVGVGVLLVIRAIIAPTPPGPGATQQQLVDFMASGDFDRISSTQRERLIDEAARRYFDSTPQQRDAVKRQWRRAGVDASLRRRIQDKLDFALACNLARDYQGLPADQRAAFLDRMLLMINTTGGGQKFMRWLDGNPVGRIFTNPGAGTRGMSRFERKLVTGTDAEQRAALAQLGGDLVRRAREQGR